MPVTVMCPNLTCRTVLRVPDKVRGKKVRCGQCNTVFSVPLKDGPAVSKAKPAASAEKAQAPSADS